jgi:hypothetical protein
MTDTTLPDPPKNEEAQRPTPVPQSDLRLLQKNLGRLAQFMASPDLLYQAIREKYGAGGTLPEQWQTLLELLPKSGPLLEVSGESGKWLVDIHSAAPPVVQAAAPPVAPPQGESQALSAAPAEPKEVGLDEEAKAAADPLEGVPYIPVYIPEPPRMVAPAAQKSVTDGIPAASTAAAPAFAPNQNESILDSIRNIQAVDQEIRNMTEERLNLERMASELRVIDISPPFEAFRSNAQFVTDALRQFPNSPPDPARVLILNQYQDNLTRGTGALLKAFFLAALGASSDGRIMNARGLTSTLRFLSTELEFASQSTDQINKMLDDLALSASPLEGAQASLLEQFRSLSGVSLEPQALRNAVSSGQQLGSLLPSLGDPGIVRFTYSKRARDLILHLRSGGRLQPLDQTDLRLLYAGKITRFSGDPNMLSLGDYARALSGADAVGAEGFIMTVFLKLGFVGYVQKTLKETDIRAQIDPELWQDLVEQAGLAKEPTGGRVLIVTGRRLEWIPSTQWAVVQLDPDLVKRLETPQVNLCMTGRDVDGEATIGIRRLVPGAKVAPLEEDATTVDEAIRRALSAPTSAPPSSSKSSPGSSSPPRSSPSSSSGPLK